MRNVALGVAAVVLFLLGLGVGFWFSSKPRNIQLAITSYDCSGKELVVAVPQGFVGKVVAEAFEIGGPTIPDYPTAMADAEVGTGQTSVTLQMDISDEKNTRIIVWAIQEHDRGDYDCSAKSAKKK